MASGIFTHFFIFFLLYSEILRSLWALFEGSWGSWSALRLKALHLWLPCRALGPWSSLIFDGLLSSTFEALQQDAASISSLAGPYQKENQQVFYGIWHIWKSYQLVPKLLLHSSWLRLHQSLCSIIMDSPRTLHNLVFRDLLGKSRQHAFRCCDAVLWERNWCFGSGYCPR